MKGPGLPLRCLKYGCDIDLALICSVEACEEIDFCKCKLIFFMLSSHSLNIPFIYRDISPPQQKRKAPNGLVDNDIVIQV